MLFSLKHNINVINSQFLIDLSSEGKLIINQNKLNIYDNNVVNLFNKFSITTLDLKENKYKDDISILDSNCLCFSCKENKYTKAYLNHLFASSELNGPIILMMHNFYYFEYLLNYFNNNNESVKDISLIEYINTILSNEINKSKDNYI